MLPVVARQDPGPALAPAFAVPARQRTTAQGPAPSLAGSFATTLASVAGPRPPRGESAPPPLSGRAVAPTRAPNWAIQAFFAPAAVTPAAGAGLLAGTRPMALDAFPRPEGDNGRGMHWVPTTSSPPEVVDRYVAEAKQMGVKWMVFLNDGADSSKNDYLVQQLTKAGIQPVMRIFTPGVEPIKGDVEGMVRHYTALGVKYFQPYNEPNLRAENPDATPDVDRYLANWLPAAKAIVRGGGLPGFGALAPGGDANDVRFLRQALSTLKERGEAGALDKAWLSIHNYAWNLYEPGRVPGDVQGRNPEGSVRRPGEQAGDAGFLRFRAYQREVQQALGREMAILSTEGGAFAGDQQDKTLPALTDATATEAVQQAYLYMRDRREPWNLAYTYWTIANEAGGGTDPAFTKQALFRADGSTSPLVDTLKRMG